MLPSLLLLQFGSLPVHRLLDFSFSQAIIDLLELALKLAPYLRLYFIILVLDPIYLLLFLCGFGSKLLSLSRLLRLELKSLLLCCLLFLVELLFDGLKGPLLS